jgi:membrane fusion protein, multidrug efflux system
VKLKVTFACILVLLAGGGLAAVKGRQIQKLVAAGKSMVPPPEWVSVAVVREEEWPKTLTAIGSITAVQGVTVTPEVTGIVREIAFESGAVVSQGDLLVRLDMSIEEAQLRAVEAQTDLARINLAREKTLRADNTVSQSDLDTAEATLKQLQADADAIRAAIAKKIIRAPFSGQLGIRLVNLGQYLNTGAPIVSLQSLAPVYADFSLPQQDLVVLKDGMRVRLSTDAYPGRAFEGELTAINPQVDAETRSVGLRAAFENPDKLLRPGMYVRVEVIRPEEERVLAIPATSVLSAPYGDSVFVIEPKSGQDHAGQGKTELMARQQFIRTGRARGDFLAVESGLKPGERIVSAGLFKLRNGMSVVESDEITPRAMEAPHPPDN